MQVARKRNALTESQLGTSVYPPPRNRSVQILLAVMIWLGFVAAVAGHMFAFRSFSLRFFATTAGSVLFALLVIGTVLGALIQ